MKDESARDKAIENVLGQKLRARSAAGNGCPDAEIVAAYFERTLPTKERSRWEAHFDSCAACQQRIAAMVRMDEAGEASLHQTPQKAALQQARQPRKAFALRWAWAAPVLLVVLVAGLWYTGEFDKVVNRHAETQQAAPQAVAPPAKPAEAAGTAKQDAGKASSQEPGSADATLQPARNAPVQGAAAGRLNPAVKAPASELKQQKLEPPPSPPPAPPAAALDVEAERKLNARETGPAGTGAGGGSGPARELPLSSRNYTQLEKAQTEVLPPPQASSSAAAAGAAQDRLAQAAPKAMSEASTTGGAVGSIQAKTENAPAPSSKGANTMFDAHSLLGGTRAKKAGQLSPAAPLSAEASFGTVRGKIRDASGAAIPGATVIATNNSNNVAKLITANEAGEYAANLDPGEYSIEAGARGFQSSTLKDIPLQARADRKLDFSLQVGAVTQTVTVEAASPVLRNLPLWRVGPHGLIQKQSAQGEWETKPSGVAVDLLDIDFPNREVGWAVGQNGTVLRSANAGESWGRVTSPTDENLVRVRATSADSAEVTTRSGAVYVTADGATTWTRVETAR